MHIKYLMIHLTPEEFNKFMAALEAPLRETSRFDELFARKSRFSKPECA